tara:strand:- start:1805 stop:2215 length:411 start_codon:yes stop_codon:yes gene_type:complete
MEKISKSEFLDKVWDYTENDVEFKPKSDKPTVIKFYADWCQPCKLYDKKLDVIEKAYEGKVNFFKVNVETEKDLAADFKIASIPATFIGAGEQVQPAILLGVVDEIELKRHLNGVINNPQSHDLTEIKVQLPDEGE